ncbi:MAG: oligosaccharide flippase family protein, partial [Crenarchaeota archaeon]|nr:oligosaccharide flippase family protein [Thermoproteota archaeon]
MNLAKYNLTSGRLLAKNTIWEFAGIVTPLFFGLFAIPMLIHGMGKERFGLLSIIWMGVGYFSLFDMGLGRALTKLVADRLGSKKLDDLGPLIWTSLCIIFILGILGSLIVIFGSKPLIQYVLKVDSSLEVEAVRAMKILGIGLPVVVITSALVGILNAYQSFAAIAVIRAPLGIMTFAGPLITLQFSESLIWTTAILILTRIFAGVIYFVYARQICLYLKYPLLPQKKHLGPLFRFGGWLTVTNIISPLMVYCDRFLIGSLISMTAVAYYITPYEVISRINIIPQALMSVLFPALATVIVSNRERLPGIYENCTLVLLAFATPIITSIFLFAPEALQFWLGDDF